MIGKATRLSGLAIAVLALALAGCTLVSPGESPLETTSSSPIGEPTSPIPTPTEMTAAPTSTVEPTPEATATVPATEPATESTVYMPVEIPDAGLTLEVPQGWTQLDEGWAWTPEAGSGQQAGTQIGVKWADLTPPQEPEAVLLPTPSEIVSSDPVELSFGSGRRIVLNVFGSGDEDGTAPVVSVQTHVLVTVVQGDVRRAYDFFAAAPSQEALATLQSAFDHMVEVAILQPVGGSADDGGTGGGGTVPEAVTQAEDILATHLGISADTISVVSYEYVEWPSACLGIQSPGQMCAAVITPGYRVVLSVAGQTFELHTNQSGSVVGIVP